MTARHEIIEGDCIDVMRGMEAGSVDTIITDPPYGLKFMGKQWDHGVPGVPFWEAALRVAKSGAFLLAFGGTRTFHRLACAIEDAGWEIRDCVMWVYGSGFPKSHDISKAIDKHGGKQVAWFGPWFQKWRKDNNVTQKQVAALFPSKAGKITGCVANWELGLNMPTASQFNAIKNAFNLPFDSLIEAERKIIGRGADYGHQAHKNIDQQFGFGANYNITGPATDAANQWHGWGTALKPAYEPICLAMKPLDGTFAQNALEHGVAGLNIEGSRVEYESETDKASATPQGKCTSKEIAAIGAEPDAGRDLQRIEFVRPQQKGRWPANLIHDGSDEVLAGFPETKGGTGETRKAGEYHNNIRFNASNEINIINYKGDGSAARFFYCAKASKAERGENNNHPTVKPLALMEYLCKLTMTPTSGVVLDPFMGSGTTGVACQHLGRRFVGIEISPEYCEMARRRIADAMPLFAEEGKK